MCRSPPPPPPLPEFYYSLQTAFVNVIINVQSIIKRTIQTVFNGKRKVKGRVLSIPWCHPLTSTDEYAHHLTLSVTMHISMVHFWNFKIAHFQSYWSCFHKIWPLHANDMNSILKWNYYRFHLRPVSSRFAMAKVVMILMIACNTYKACITNSAQFPSMPGTFVLQQDTLSTLLLSTQVYKWVPSRMWRICCVCICL